MKSTFTVRDNLSNKCCFIIVSALLVFSLVLFLSFVALALPGIAHAQEGDEDEDTINHQIYYQGILQDREGEAVRDGSYNMVFRLYNLSEGGAVLWTGTHTAANGNPVTTQNGVFSVRLGSGIGNSLTNFNFNQDTLYLGITVGTDTEMTPRQRLASAASAFNADKLDGLDSSSFARNNGVLRLGLTTRGEIDTVSGSLTLDSHSGTVIVDDALSVIGTTTLATTTLQGILDTGSNRITNLAGPDRDTDAATKGYVDTSIEGLVWQAPVQNIAATPPTLPTAGDRYIVASASATGAWAGKENTIAEWRGTAWRFTSPTFGFTTFVQALDKHYTFTEGSDSIPDAWVAADANIDHNSLGGLQGGTTGQYYHLTQATYAALTDTNAQLTALHVDGSPTFNGLTLNGALTDGTNSAGIDGMVLQTTGTSVRWVATSTLGFADASLWSKNGTTAHYTDGNVGIGTTTAASKLSVNGNVLMLGAGRYLNFGSATGTAGYGIRDNAGTLEFKNTSGTWAGLASPFTSVAGEGTRYDISTATFSEIALSVSAQDTNPTDFIFNNDGTTLYVMGTTGEDINAYTLGTAYDISTATFSEIALSVSAQDTNPTDFIFNNDGTTLYVLGKADDDISAYTLGTPYDISTATTTSATTTLSVKTETNFPQALLFNNDGTTLYVLDDINANIYAYTLSAAYDISTASTTSATTALSVSAQEAFPKALLFNNDGTTLYVMGIEGDDVNAYTLRTPYDISTATFSKIALSVSTQDNGPADFIFNNDGTTLYVLGDGGDDINAYTIPFSQNAIYATDATKYFAIGTDGNTHARLTVHQTASNPQFRVSYDALNFVDFTVNALGDLVIKTSTGGDLSLLDENLRVCAGGACPTDQSTFAGTGNIVAENKVFTEGVEPLSCPTGMIPVPAMPETGLRAGFCVDKYEAKNVSGIATSQSSGTPWVSISQTSARAQCLRAGKTLLTEQQRLAIARNVEDVGWNWEGGVAGTNQMSDGHADGTPGNPIAAAADTDPCSGTGQNCSTTTWNTQRRTYQLSNGEYIWDFGGNVDEWTDAVRRDGYPVAYGGTGVTPCSTAGDGRCGNTRTTNDTVSNTTSGTHGFLRGGSYDRTGAQNAGAFAFNVQNTSASTFNTSGFRCAQ